MIAALTPRTIAVAVVIAMLALVPVYAHLVGNLFVLSLFTRIVILAMAAVSLNLIMAVVLVVRPEGLFPAASK